MRLLWAGLALLGLAGAAEARQHYPARGHRIIPANAAPLDSFAQPSGAYSFRKLRSSYTGPAVRLRRASDNAEVDIDFLGYTSFTGAPWDEAAANAHCASTSCFIKTWYAQAGTLDLVQATAANQPQLIFNCNGTLPCLRFVSATQNLVSATTITPATGTLTLAAVAKRAAGTAACVVIRENAVANRLQMTAAAATWTLFGGTGGTVVATAADGAWHSGIGVVAGASSVLNIDGTETGGTATGNVVAGAPSLAGGAATTCDQSEIVIWDNYVTTPSERAALIANQRSYGLIP